MEAAEPPECPVCLQPYDAVSAIPRVLTCGHTTCELCLKQLPNPFPNTIRCTVCTLLVKFPNCPSSLPKNLDLLHFSSVLQGSHGAGVKDVASRTSPSENGEKQTGLLPLTLKSWSYEFYCKWRKWILPEDCILIDQTGLGNDDETVYGEVSKPFESDYAVGCVLKEREKVGLAKIGMFVENDQQISFLNPSYESKIVSLLRGMKEEKRDELRVILNATNGVSNVGKVYGLWYNGSNKCFYMVCKKFTKPNLSEFILKKKSDEDEGLSSDEMRGFAMLGMEACENLSHLHLEGVVVGLLSVDCLSFNDFGRITIDLCEIFHTGRRVSMVMLNAHKDMEVGLKNSVLDENLAFICPQMLLQFHVKEGIVLDRDKSKYEIGCASDVWSLACLLVWLIVGSSFVEELGSYINFVGSISTIKDGIPDFYTGWMEKVAMLLESRLGDENASLGEVLCRCLEFEPENRPAITELWKTLKELVVKDAKYCNILHLNRELTKENSSNFVLAKFSQIDGKSGKELMGRSENDQADVELSRERDITAAVSGGHFKYVEMKGHLDCVTGLAVAGGFVFSSSYDKTVKVWSLQDFKQVQSLKGHEHRVMAVVAVDGEQPLCISGDGAGVICIWKASFPFSEMPIRKLHEQKDWRYSGIHAMAVSGMEYLYTGSGDKLVKAWSLQDYTMSCAMGGHKSVVSSLVVCDGVLYSGSWDGTVRLWSLSDHAPLAVLGEDKTESMLPVSCLSAEHSELYVGHDNGCIKIWRNDLLLKSTQTHKGAVFSISKKGKWLFSGGWDKTITLQEISEHRDGLEVTPVGSIACNSAVTALLYQQEKLFVGQANKTFKVYHGV
ncbi:uncharacterized protein LOC127246240 [Andrographis paniculata]|uniref:uncharacterized protein LOC127246240 n=1 Tax=Andrographis paniculata TaxID=175694 RepID=UPI0021E95843|nr:uncharacterized protein LOC127246240 [Andrographis paniculata]